MSLSIAAMSGLATLCYLYPTTIFIFSAIASVVATCTLQDLKYDTVHRPMRINSRFLIVSFSLFLVTYAAQLAILCVHAALIKAWAAEEYVIIGRLSCFLVFGIQLSRLLDTERPSAVPLWGSVLLALIFEVTIAVWSTLTASAKFTGFFALSDLILSILRCTILTVLASCAIVTWWTASKASAEETESLLPKTDNPTSYGATQGNDDENNEIEYSWQRRRREARESMEKRLRQNGNWFQYVKGFMVSSLFPLISPVLIDTDSVPICLARRQQGPADSCLCRRRLPLRLQRPTPVDSSPDWYHHGQFERRKPNEPLGSRTDICSATSNIIRVWY